MIFSARRSSISSDQRQPWLLLVIGIQDLGDQVLRRLDAPAKRQLKLVCRSLREQINSRTTSASFIWSFNREEEWVNLLLCLPKLQALSSLCIFDNCGCCSPSTTAAAAAIALASADPVVRRTRQGTILLPGGRQPLCERLCSLKLEKRARSSAELAAIFSVPWPALEELMLSGSFFRSAMGVSCRDSVRSATVLAAAALPRLRRLALVRYGLLPQAVVALAQGRWPQLEELDLSSNGWDSSQPSLSTADQVAAVTALATSTLGSRLRILNASCIDMCPEAVTALVQGRWPCLESLTLYRNNVESEGSATLCQPGSLPALRRIGLQSSSLNPRLAASLASRTGLTSLGLANVPFAPHGICSWPSLQALELIHPTSQGLHPAHFPNVSHLTLHCSVLLHLVRELIVTGPNSGRWWPSQVQQLHFNGCYLAAYLFEALASADWPVLRVVRVERTSPGSPEVRNALRLFLARCPSLQEHNLEQLLS